MFVPQAWNHATLNLQASVALAVEVGVWEKWQIERKAVDGHPSIEEPWPEGGDSDTDWDL